MDLLDWPDGLDYPSLLSCGLGGLPRWFRLSFPVIVWLGGLPISGGPFGRAGGCFTHLLTRAFLACSFVVCLGTLRGWLGFLVPSSCTAYVVRCMEILGLSLHVSVPSDFCSRPFPSAGLRLFLRWLRWAFYSSRAGNGRLL